MSEDQIKDVYTDDATKVIDDELDLILGKKESRDRALEHRLVGLALSGGGVRSASFSLGVLQALANAERLENIHYMSTVSGGGYIGSALSWFTIQSKTSKDKSTEDFFFSTEKEEFPFGAKELANFETYQDPKRNGLINRGFMPRVAILDHIRQHGSYLSAKGSWDLVKLVTMSLRAMIPSFAVYFLMIMLPIALFAYLLALEPLSHADLMNGYAEDNLPKWSIQQWIYENGAWRLALGLMIALSIAFLAEASLTRLHSVRENTFFGLPSSLVFILTIANMRIMDSPHDVLIWGFYIFYSVLLLICTSSIFLSFGTFTLLASYTFYTHEHSIYWTITIVLINSVLFHKFNKKGKEIIFVYYLSLFFSIVAAAIVYHGEYHLDIFLWSTIASLSIFLAEEVSISSSYLNQNKKNNNALKMNFIWRKENVDIDSAIVIIIFGLIISGFLPIVKEFSDVELGTGLTAASITAYFFNLFKEVWGSGTKWPRFEIAVTTFVSVALVFGLLLLAFSLCDYFWTFRDWESLPPPELLKLSLELLGISVSEENGPLIAKIGFFLFVANISALGWLLASRVNLNFVGLHRLYRDRLMDTFLPNVSEDGQKVGRQANEPLWSSKANEFFMYQLSDVWREKQIYHIINTNVVLVNSDDARYRGRGGANFIISPEYCGSKATGWLKSENWKMPAGQMTLASAMAVSGAAINPKTGPGGRGPMQMPLVSFLMTFFNARLGMWVNNPNPRVPPKHTELKDEDELPEFDLSPNFYKPGLMQGLLGLGHKETEPFIELTDGGHFDNTGLYELIRRRMRLIIMVDGSADKELNFGDLASAFERIRADFGVQIRFGRYEREFQSLLHNPDKKHAFTKKLELAERGYVVARIDYQPHEDGKSDDDKDGMLVIIKSTMVEGLPADVLGYKSAHPDFPDESTADQFFDELQLEAYRELGYRIAKTALDDPVVDNEFQYCVKGYRYWLRQWPNPPASWHARKDHLMTALATAKSEPPTH